MALTKEDISRYHSYEEFKLALNENNIETANHYVILNESKGFSQDGKTEKANNNNNNKKNPLKTSTEDKLALLIDVASQFLS